MIPNPLVGARVFILCFSFFVICYSIVATAFAQTVDDPKRLLKKAYNLEISSPVDGMKYANEAFLVAQKTEDIDTQVRALILLGSIEQALEHKKTAISHLAEAVRLLELDNRAGQAGGASQIALVCSDLASLYRDIKEFDTSLSSAKKSVTYARKSDDAYSGFRAYTSLGNSYKNVKKYQESLGSFQEAQVYANKLDQNKYKMIAYTNLARSYKAVEDIEASLEFHKKALLLSEEIGDLEDIALYLEYISTAQRKLGLYSEALANATRALSVQRVHNNTNRITGLLLSISIIYRKLGSYDKALEYAFELTLLQEKENNISGMASAYNTIGLIYDHIERYDESQRYHKMTLSLPPKKAGDKNRASAFRGIANVFQLKGDYNQALKSAEEAKYLYDKIHSISGADSTNRMIGIIQVKLGNTAKAIKAFEESLALSRLLKDSWSEASTLIQLGKLFKDSSPNTSIVYLEEGLAIAQEIKSLSLSLEIYENLIEIEKNKENFKKAYYYSKIIIKLFSDMSATEINKRTEEIRNVNELEIQEKELELLHSEARIKKLQLESASFTLDVMNSNNTISNLQLQKVRYARVILIGLSIVVMVALILLYNRYQAARRDQEILNKKNLQIASKNKDLEALGATKDRFLSIISHDLRGPVSSLVSLSEMVCKNFDSYSPKQIHEYIHAIFESVSQSNKLLNELLEWAIQQLRNADPEPKKYLISQLCEPVAVMLRPCANNKNIKINTNLNDINEVYVDKNMITTVIRNLITNALKFTPEGGAVEIFSERNELHTTIHIKDSGVGIDEKDLHNLFDVDNTFSRLGTAGETGAGFGLSLCKGLVRKNGGNIFVSSKKGGGSDFYFELPNSN